MHNTDLPVIVIGAGGHAQVLIEALKLIGRRVLSITDSAHERLGQSLGGILIEGPDELVLEHDPNHVELVNAIGSVGVPQIRRKVNINFTSRGYRFATIVHPSATVSPSAKLAQGAQIMAGAVIQARAVIGTNAIINTCASVDHDCSVGAHSHLAPSVTLSGNVSVGHACHLGTAASVIQAVTIDHFAFVAAGAVVTSDVPAYGNVRGVPAKPRP